MATVTKVESANHTPMQVRVFAETALDIADVLALSSEDRAVLLPAILALLGAKSVTYVQEDPIAPLFSVPNHRG